jgi:hypothetical protein
MASSEQLEEEISKIKERNKRVETEKAWETSWTRRCMVVFFTYITMSLVFYFLGTPDPLENAVIPSIAFILSTLSGPMVKKYWLKNIHKG